jgi:hypothetical protein
LALNCTFSELNTVLQNFVHFQMPNVKLVEIHTYCQYI